MNLDISSNNYTNKNFLYRIYKIINLFLFVIYVTDVQSIIFVDVLKLPSILMFLLLVSLLCLNISIYFFEDIKLSKLKIFHFSVFVGLYLIYFIIGYPISNKEEFVTLFFKVFVPNVIFVAAFVLFFEYLTIHDHLSKLKLLKSVAKLILLFVSLNIVIGSMFLNDINLVEVSLRNSGSFGNANLAGQHILLSLAVFITLLLFTKKVVLSDYFIIIFSGYALLTTASRGATLLSLIILFTYFMYSKNISKIIKSIILLISVTVIFLWKNILFLVSPDYFYRIQRLDNANNFSNGRYDTFIGGLKDFYNNNFFGNGIGNDVIESLGLGSHNMYIRLMQEIGVFSFFIIFIYLFIVIRLIFYKKKNLIILSLILFLTPFFTHNLLFFNGFYYVIAFLIVIVDSKISFKKEGGD